MTKRGRDHRKSREAGVALLLALWILALLVVVAQELIASGRVRVFTELNQRDDLSGLALALAGYHDALAALEKVTGLKWDEDKQQLLLYFPGKSEGIPATREKVKIGDGAFSWSIADEDGRISINDPKTQRDVLEKMLEKCGLGPGADRDTVIDSILDWRDQNREHRLNGAEEDYYQSLKEPYSCKDGDFDVVEELLLVKGIRDKPQLFSGGEVDGEKVAGLRNLATTFVPAGTQVNPATAPEAVLKVLGKSRASKPLQSNDISIVATGHPDGEAPPRSLRAVVRRDPGRKPPFTLLYWNDNYIPE